MLADADPTVGYDRSIMVALALALTGCSLRQDGEPASQRPVGPPPSTQATAGVTGTSGPAPRQPARPGRLAEALRRLPARVYVPNSGSNTVDVIDARTFRRVRRIPVGLRPQYGVWVIDAKRPRVRGFVHTGFGAHALYASRDSRHLYVSNRGEGSISLISFATRRVARTWRLPGGGSPDMGGVSADGKVLWLAGRYSLGHTGVLR
jgi:YVTN family beta-propeller protein